MLKPTIPLKTLADNVDEWPLSVASEEMRPDLQYGHA